MPIRYLIDLPTRNSSPIPWVDVMPNFPWDDPEFSRRMLREHLDPAHDTASRRPDVMAAQIEWMHEIWFRPRGVKKILDLACGPGLIANSLARKGYSIKGFDIAPASINYARKIASNWNLEAAFVQGDIREVDYGSGYDAVIFNYGLPNSFKNEELSAILKRIAASLNPRGIVILELITPVSMRNEPARTWHTRITGGLFGDRPYISLREYFFNPNSQSACEIHYVVDLETSEVTEYSICYRAYIKEDLDLLLNACGLKIIAEFDSLTGDKNLQKPDMYVVVAERSVG